MGGGFDIHYHQFSLHNDRAVAARGSGMKKFTQSGGFFMLVALICFVAGFTAENGTVFMSIGGFWLVMAIIARSKYAKKQPPASHS